MANRQVKDSVFRKLFNNRRELAKLYQAILKTDVPVLPQDLKITTLRNVFLDSQKNDLSFLWKGQSVVLIEHQSTWNENMPLRMLPYIDKVYRKIIKERDAKRAIYLPKLIKIPTPKFYILYNGLKLKEPRPELKLSDAFENPDGGDLELICHVIDISYDSSNEILQSCEPLRDYSYLVHLIHENHLRGMNDDEAIRQAVLVCMDQDVLKDFLHQFGKEVVNMFSLQWDEEEAKKYWTEDAMERGKAEGKAEGEGNIILGMIEDHDPLAKIMRISKWSADQIRALAAKNGLVVE